MTIKFYDVEHGSCTHIITPNNKHIMIDTGSKTYNSITTHIKNHYFRYEDGNIDELIITHPHEDHIYDLPRLYNMLKPCAFSRPRGAFDIIPTQDTVFHREIANYANKMNREYIYPINDDENTLYPSNNGGVDIEIISPPDELTTKDDLNTFSSIIIVQYEGYKFILTGDNPRHILQNMIESNYCNVISKISNATILLAPHHGRTGEFCASFFEIVNPYLTVVSDKSISHTTQEETARLYKGRGANLNGIDRFVLTTRNDGTIKFIVKANSCTVYMNNEEY